MTPLRKQILITLIYIYLNCGECYGSCYFPPELQGSYLTQSTFIQQNHQVQYSEVNITGYSIPIWGTCHKRVGNNVILSSEEAECFRCFNLKLVAKNILRVITTEPDFISKCYTNEEKALGSCPSDEILMNPFNYTKIIHYKYLDMDGNHIRYEYCPINGRYKFTYNNDDGKDDAIECISKNSELDNCPSGSAMNLRFKECPFENHELRFECLGHWTDLDGKNYLALVNNGPYNNNRYNNHHIVRRKREISSPQFRCGIFEEDPITGSFLIQFSKDSTCTISNDNHNNNNSDNLNTNSETLILYPQNHTIYWPNYNYCKYPDWLQGEWQHITVKNDTFIFRDQISFKSYTMKCIEQNIDDTILVYSRTQCDEESYKCLKIKYRSNNVIEFQMSAKSSINYESNLCSDENFDDSKWLTQGHLNETYFSCPVSGILEGMLPDASNLCAKLSSDCKSQDIMHYEVSFCYVDVLEEREYRCLGQWIEDDYVFTYTRRLDIGAYECFIGAVKDNHTIFIKEAGEHCQRNIDPLKYGMELKQIETCSSLLSSSSNSNSLSSVTFTTESPTNFKSSKFLSTPTPTSFSSSSSFIPFEFSTSSPEQMISSSPKNIEKYSIQSDTIQNRNGNAKMLHTSSSITFSTQQTTELPLTNNNNLNTNKNSTINHKDDKLTSMKKEDAGINDTRPGKTNSSSSPLSLSPLSIFLYMNFLIYFLLNLKLNFNLN